MKRIPFNQIRPGMVLARDVLSFNNQLIIAKGTELTDKLIIRLDLYGVLTVFVEDDIPSDTIKPADVKPLSYSERIKNSKNFQQFKKSYELNVDSFKDEINQVVEKNMAIDVDRLLNHSLQIVASNKGQINVLDMLQNMRYYDDSTFAHCMNVALICNLFAKWLKMDEKDIELATACGLLHDIGKLLVPKEIITKPGKLTKAEFKEIQKHPKAGYNILKDQHIDEHIKYAALMHHERNDGTGYPMAIKGPQIDKFAKLVSIADVYDAMTAARVYRGPLCPFRVIEMFEDDGFQKYDVTYLLIFLENVVNTYIKNRCLLSDGREAEIVYINKNYLSRPMVQCGSEYVDLSQCDIYVKSLI